MSNIYLLVLLAYVSWGALLALTVVMIRTIRVLQGKNKSNDFPADREHGEGFYRRAMRAHLNTIENLILAAPVLLVAYFSKIIDHNVETWALVLLGARLGQSITHLLGLSEWHVNVRFAFFLAQLTSLGVMIYYLADDLKLFG